MNELVISALSGIAGMFLENVRKFIHDKLSQKKALACLKPKVLDIAKFIIKDIHEAKEVYNISRSSKGSRDIPEIKDVIALENYNKDFLNVDTQIWCLNENSIKLTKSLDLELTKLAYAWEYEKVSHSNIISWDRFTPHLEDTHKQILLLMEKLYPEESKLISQLRAL